MGVKKDKMPPVFPAYYLNKPIQHRLQTQQTKQSTYAKQQNTFQNKV